MSYNEHTWQTGETITAEKLNNLEGGVQEALAGSDVEVIKIATAQGGGGGNPFCWAGGFLISDNKTVGDLVGNKSVVGFTYQVTNNSSSMLMPYYGMQMDIAEYVSGKSNPMTFTQDEIKGITGGGIYGIIHNGQSSFTYTVDIYAICV